MVKDFLPAGTRFISANDTAAAASAAFFCTHDGSATGGVVTCTGGDLSGSVNTIPGRRRPSRGHHGQVFAPNTPGTYTNLATVDPDNLVPEGNEFDNDVAAHRRTRARSAAQRTCSTSSTIDEDADEPRRQRGRDDSVVDLRHRRRRTTAAIRPSSGRARHAAGRLHVHLRRRHGRPADANAFVCSPVRRTVTASAAPQRHATRLLVRRAARTIEVKARLLADTPGNYTNHAFVDPNNAIPEGNETNNSAHDDDGRQWRHRPVHRPQGRRRREDRQHGHAGIDDHVHARRRRTSAPIRRSTSKCATTCRRSTTFVSAVDTTVDPDGAFELRPRRRPASSAPAARSTARPATRSRPAARRATIIVKVPAPTSIDQFVADQADISLDDLRTRRSSIRTTRSPSRTRRTTRRRPSRRPSSRRSTSRSTSRARIGDPERHHHVHDHRQERDEGPRRRRRRPSASRSSIRCRSA